MSVWLSANNLLPPCTFYWTGILDGRPEMALFIYIDNEGCYAGGLLNGS